MSLVLVFNSGSSSFKYQLINPETEEVFASGLVEKIGSEVGIATHKVGPEVFEVQTPIADYEAGIQLMRQAFRQHGPEVTAEDLLAIGHRVVQGGARYSGPVIVTEKVEQDIDELSALAPLHNPAAVVSIRAAKHIYPNLPHVAVFDTAFHQTMPAKHYRYAIDPEVAKANRVRKYGFHGTSHGYVTEQAAKFLGVPLEEFNAISLHLGNGASATAIKAGKSLNTSMGMTPLEGLVMGTRSGDIDPAVLFHLHRKAQLTFDELDDLLNKKSGLAGLTGSADMRDVQQRAAGGDQVAIEALELYYERVKFYLGGYLAQLGRVDAIIFTAGVGENSAPTRAGILAGLEQLGIKLDSELNQASGGGIRLISAEDSTPVLVVPTNEELAIAKLAVQTIALAASSPDNN